MTGREVKKVQAGGSFAGPGDPRGAGMGIESLKTGCF